MNFGDEIPLREKNVKPGKKFNFSEKRENDNFSWKPKIF